MAAAILTRRLPRLLPGVILLAALGCVPVQAQEAPAKEISEKVSEQFNELRPLIEAKKFAEAITVIDRVIGEISADSYDFVILTQMKAQILITQGDLNKAADPVEKSLAVAEKYAFLEPKAIYEQLYLLCQIYYQQAAEQKTPEAQQPLFEKSYGYLKRAMTLAPKPTTDLQLFAASLLYNQGSLGKTLDQEKIRQSIAEAKKGLYLSLRPPEQLYQLVLSGYQQIGDLEHAAETLELMLIAKPQNAQFWQQLVALYMNLAGATKDETAAQAYNLRAIITIERAQAKGLLSSPPENYTLVALYFTIQQFSRAASLLEKGLKDGAVENQKRNWELLSNAYQQMKKDTLAIDALKRASALFPADGQIEFSIGQLYYGVGKVEDAYRHALAATTKGQLEKPGQTLLYLAYLGYELGKLEDAAGWAEKASTHDDVKPGEIAPIKRAIADAIKERQALTIPSKA